MPTHHLWINGAWSDTAGGTQMPIENPATGETIAHVVDASRAEMTEKPIANPASEFQAGYGALYGDTENPGYSVNVGTTVNPLTNIAKGLITAVIKAKTSPFAAELKLTLTRRAITEQVAA